MANGDDTPDACCAISLCCGGDDDHKRIDALARLLAKEIGKPGPYTSHEAAAAIVEHWDLVPRSWGLAAFLLNAGRLARKFPYTG